MNEEMTEKKFSQRLISTLNLSGIMIVVILTFDAARAWSTNVGLPNAEFLGFGLIIIWGITSVLVIRRTGLIRYGILAAAIVAIMHATVGIYVANFIAERQTPGFFEPPYYMIRGIQLYLLVAVVVAGLTGYIWVRWIRPK